LRDFGDQFAAVFDDLVQQLRQHGSIPTLLRGTLRRDDDERQRLAVDDFWRIVFFDQRQVADSAFARPVQEKQKRCFLFAVILGQTQQIAKFCPWVLLSHKLLLDLFPSGWLL